METDKTAYIYILLVSACIILVHSSMLDFLDYDVFYHLLVAGELIKQKTLFLLHDPWFNHPSGLIHYYPPLFHWILALSSLIAGLEKGALFLKLMFYPLALLSIYHLVSHVEGRETAFLSVILLSITPLFYTRVHLAIPESLQHVLIPLIFLFYLRGNAKLSGLITSLTLANHLYDSLLVFFAVSAHCLLYRKKTFNITNYFLFSLPGMVIQLYGVYAHSITYWAIYNISLLQRLSLMTVVLLGVVIPMVFLFWFIRRGLLDKTNSIFLVWFLFTLPILPGLPLRFPPYTLVPLMVLSSILFMDLRKEVDFRLLYMPLIVFLLITQVFLSPLSFSIIAGFQGPCIDADERKALTWLRDNLPPGEPILLTEIQNPLQGFMKSVPYFTGHPVTGLLNQSRYLYTLSEIKDDNWSLAVEYGIYRIYHRNQYI
ncbi:MAG: hypothetical protein B6U72_01550 [Candidatus Altiarchaeales archaeon ex4484_2]|nr:MAG: hypothetical protein B6U72_01550 [Candidatus Altiarchaeales archaeon ex4484_2]